MLVPVGALFGVPGLVVVVVVVPGAAPFPEFDAGVAAGVDAGKVVIGVGSGGNGLARTPATIASIPSVLSPFRYL